MLNLNHLIYTSVANKDFSQSELIDLLNIARANNSKKNISGILLYVNKNFFQVIEGELEALQQLFSIIKKDPRHGNVTKIICESIVKRNFNEWSMGFDIPETKDLQELTGINDFFGNKTCLTDLDDGRAKKILEAYAEGVWRDKIK